MLFYEWANDETTRRNSYNQEPISLDHHKRWFLEKLVSDSCSIYLFVDENDLPIGQVRIEDKGACSSLIGISVDAAHRGKGYA
ncbi:GNAT family N-acetyltransferase, partial [Flavitalea antarctica]